MQRPGADGAARAGIHVIHGGRSVRLSRRHHRHESKGPISRPASPFQVTSKIDFAHTFWAEQGRRTAAGGMGDMLVPWPAWRPAVQRVQTGRSCRTRRSRTSSPISRPRACPVIIFEAEFTEGDEDGDGGRRNLRAPPIWADSEDPYGPGPVAIALRGRGKASTLLQSSGGSAKSATTAQPPLIERIKIFHEKGKMEIMWGGKMRGASSAAANHAGKREILVADGRRNRSALAASGGSACASHPGRRSLERTRKGTETERGDRRCRKTTPVPARS